VSRSKRGQQILHIGAERDEDPNGIIEEFVSRNAQTIESLMPLVGAAGGAIALEVVSQRVPLKKDALAAVGAGLAFLAGTNATGSTRQLAMGAAAGGACYAIVEALRSRRPKAIYGEPKPVEAATRQAAPSGISREEFQQALDNLAQQRDAQIAEIKKQSDDAVEKLRTAYETRIAEMQTTIHSLLQQLRDASAARAAARNAGRRRVPPVHAQQAPVGVVEEAPALVVEAAPPAVEAPPVVVDLEPPTDEATARLAVIYSQLTDDEVERLREILTNLAVDALAVAQAHLLSLSTNEAVAYLRDHVLASPKAA
jgi:hypothetical protein